MSAQRKLKPTKNQIYNLAQLAKVSEIQPRVIEIYLKEFGHFIPHDDSQEEPQKFSNKSLQRIKRIHQLRNQGHHNKKIVEELHRLDASHIEHKQAMVLLSRDEASQLIHKNALKDYLFRIHEPLKKSVRNQDEWLDFFYQEWHRQQMEIRSLRAEIKSIRDQLKKK